jgi:hypothetical protein
VQLARQGPALRAHAEQPAIAARPAPEIHFHGGTHLHIGNGDEAADLIRRSIPGNPIVITDKENY